MFVHGLESNAQGFKAVYLARHFEVVATEMDTTFVVVVRGGDKSAKLKVDADRFERCVQAQMETLRRCKPDVLFGSSFGGAVCLRLIEKGAWRGPTVLLAQAHLVLFPDLPPPSVPVGMPITFIHGLRDTVVPIEGSRRLAELAADANGSAVGDDIHSVVRLVMPDDTHGLQTVLGIPPETAEQSRLPNEHELNRFIVDCWALADKSFSAL